jgi:hypothetical protein
MSSSNSRVGLKITTWFAASIGVATVSLALHVVPDYAANAKDIGYIVADQAMVRRAEVRIAADSSRTRWKADGRAVDAVWSDSESHEAIAHHAARADVDSSIPTTQHAPAARRASGVALASLSVPPTLPVVSPEPARKDGTRKGEIQVATGADEPHAHPHKDARKHGRKKAHPPALFDAAPVSDDKSSEEVAEGEKGDADRTDVRHLKGADGAIEDAEGKLNLEPPSSGPQDIRDNSGTGSTVTGAMAFGGREFASWQNGLVPSAELGATVSDSTAQQSGHANGDIAGSRSNGISGTANGAFVVMNIGQNSAANSHVQSSISIQILTQLP